MNHAMVSESLLGDPRLEKLAHELGVAGVLPSPTDLALAKLVRLWIWGVTVAGPTGNLSGQTMGAAATACRIPEELAAGFTRALKESGFLSESAKLAGWKKLTGSVLVRREESRKSMRKTRMLRQRCGNVAATLRQQNSALLSEQSKLSGGPGAPGARGLKAFKLIPGNPRGEHERGDAAPEVVEIPEAAKNPPTQQITPSEAKPEPSPEPAGATLASSETKSDPTPRPTRPKPPEPLPAIPAALDTTRFREAWELFLRHRVEKRTTVKPTHAGQLLRRLAGEGEASAVDRLRRSVENGWQGLFFPGEELGGRRSPKPRMVLGPDHEDKYADLEPRQRREP